MAKYIMLTMGKLEYIIDKLFFKMDSYVFKKGGQSWQAAK